MGLRRGSCDSWVRHCGTSRGLWPNAGVVVKKAQQDVLASPQQTSNTQSLGNVVLFRSILMEQHCSEAEQGS